MPADSPTIVATSGGFTFDHPRLPVAFGPLVDHCVELSGVHRRRPRITYVGTAIGDQEFFAHRMFEAARVAGFDLTELRLFPTPNLDDMRGAVLDSDVVWVMGGSVVNLLAVWRAHGLDAIMREAWEAGVVLGGVSAGSICWHVGGTTDSYGPDLRPVTDGLGLLPYANGVHYDAEEQRRPLLQRLVADGTLPPAYATDEGVGLVYRDTELVDVVAEVPDAAAYRIVRDGEGAVEERIGARRI